MRVALVHCSAEEAAAVRQQLRSAEVFDTAEDLVVPPAADFAVLGSATLRDGGIDPAVLKRVSCAAAVIVTSAAASTSFDADVAAVTMEGMGALPFIVQREVRRFKSADLLAQVPGVVWSADRSGRILFMSDQITQLAGYTSDEIRAEGSEFWNRAIHGDDLPPVSRGWLSLIRGGAFETEFRLRHKNGEMRWIHVRAALVDVGEPTVVGVSTDVTARHTAEEALRASEARYRTLVEQAKDIIVAIDLEGRIVTLNRAAEEVTGGSRVEWIGRPIFDALTPESAIVAEERFAEVLAGFEPENQSEYRLRTRKGRPVTVEARVQAVRSAGSLVGIVMVARDVTARKEAAAREEKDRRLASLGQLATSVAHEFNNVLMSIMPFAELLMRRMPNDDRVVTSASHIIQAVRRGREISQEILRFARPVPAELVPVNVSQWVEEFATKAEAILGPSYRVAIDVPPRAVYVAADRSLLDQVALNLTLNSRDAMPGGGDFTIAVRSDGGSVQIDFSDTGCGIPPEQFERVFEPLFSTKRGGNGLGLSIAHQAMVQQNGAIHLRSAAGEGTTFTLSMLEVAGERGSPATTPATSVRRILVVEDDRPVGEGLRMLLEDEGFDVRLVERGMQAMPAIEAFKPDVVLLDVNLPDINGVEIYGQIRNAWPSLAVIFSTGHADARALTELRGRVPSIMKPYDLGELLSLMTEVIP